MVTITNEASHGVHKTVTKVKVYTDINKLVADGKLFNYGSSDSYKVKGVGITEAQFEQLMESGKNIPLDIAYSASRGLSTFDIHANSNGLVNGWLAPKLDSAAVGNHDNGAKNDDVKVKFTTPENNTKHTVYQLQRAASCRG